MGNNLYTHVVAIFEGIEYLYSLRTEYDTEITAIEQAIIEIFSYICN